MVASSESLCGVRVAILEDDPDALELFAMALENAGALVHSATRATEVLSSVADWHPAVVVIDIAVPEMDGFELLRAIRRPPALCDAPAIAISGWTNAHTHAAALAAGFQEYLEKPIDPFELVTRVANCFRREGCS